MKRIAGTLANILENEVVSVALDRTESIDGVVKDVKKQWQVDLDGRNPAPAYKEVIDGVQFYTGTDFDLFTFVNALADRKAVINLPHYENIAPRTMRDDQRVISNRDRHGAIMGIIANKENHAFSVRINDYQVLQLNPDGSETVGAPRNFALVDHSGQLYSGWGTIQVRTTDKEKEFIENNELGMDNRVIFENFVHPNLAFAFYGSRYLATKALGERIADEAKHYRQIASGLREEGINLGGMPKPEIRSFRENDYTRKESVQNLEAKLVLPEFSGKYPILGRTRDGEIKEYERVPSSRKARENILRFAENRAKELSYRIGPQITAPVRAVELAYFQNGFESGIKRPGYEKQPGWNIPEWERRVKLAPNARTEWNALDLGDVVLAYRIRQTTVTKAA